MVVLISLLAGCSTVPFDRKPFRLICEVNPESVREEFANKLAVKFKTVSSIVFSYKFQSFAGIGYATVTDENETFAALCLNPAGITIFEIKGSQDSTEEMFFSEQFKEYGDATGAVADDIRKIYFNRIPPVGARIKEKRREIVFTQPFFKGKIEYIFAGKDMLCLEEKRYKEKGRKVWTVWYEGYKEKDGKVHPWRILFKNHKYDYSLRVNTKEFDS